MYSTTRIPSPKPPPHSLLYAPLLLPLKLRPKLLRPRPPPHYSCEGPPRPLRRSLQPAGVVRPAQPPPVASRPALLLAPEQVRRCHKTTDECAARSLSSEFPYCVLFPQVSPLEPSTPPVPTLLRRPPDCHPVPLPLPLKPVVDHPLPLYEEGREGWEEGDGPLPGIV